MRLWHCIANAAMYPLPACSADVVVKDTVNPPWFIDRDPEAIKDPRHVPDRGGQALPDMVEDSSGWCGLQANPRQAPGSTIANLER